MNITKKSILLIIILICGLNCYSQQRLKLAVLDPVIAGEKLTDGLAISVREIVSGSFVNNADNYAIVERSLIDKVMQEAKFSNSDAVDESQATQLGKLAGADKVVLTVISRFDNRCMMSIKLIDVESATIDKQISKLVDLSSLLDVTEPLTLAVLGKADASLISNQAPISNLPQNTGKTLDIQSSPQSNSINTPVVLPSFNGSGISYTDAGYVVEPQMEDFNIYKFDQLYMNNNFNIIIDLSEAIVMGMTLPQFIEMKRRNAKEIKVFGDEFFYRMNSEVERFLKALNKETKVLFTYNPQSAISLLIKVRTIDEPGRENVSDYVFIDNNTKQVLTGIRLKSKGGKFGSWTNLLGDAFEEDAAPNFGKKFNAAKKKYNKSIGD